MFTKFKFILFILCTLLLRYIYLIELKGNSHKLFFSLFLKSSKYIIPCISFLKNSFFTEFFTLADICVVDHPKISNRFEVVYNLQSFQHSLRLFVHTFLSKDSYLFSLSSIYKSADWLERECWDLYGVFFFGHWNLRRILTDYGFEGFPLRKDFPLSGYIELRYDDSNMAIAYEPVELSQEYRVFNFISPWENFG